MTLAKADIEIVDGSTKWGLLVFVDERGAVVREVEISAEEADAVATGKKRLPDGCTAEEWETGRVALITRPLKQGQALVQEDGSLVVNYGIEKTGDRVQADVMWIPAPSEEREWWRLDQAKGEVSVDVQALNAMPKLDPALKLLGGK